MFCCTKSKGTVNSTTLLSGTAVPGTKTPNKRITRLASVAALLCLLSSCALDGARRDDQRNKAGNNNQTVAKATPAQIASALEGFLNTIASPNDAASYRDEINELRDFEDSNAELADGTEHMMAYYRDLSAIPSPPTNIGQGHPLYDLGQALAFDPLLSGGQDITCLDCHHPTLGTTDQRALGLGTAAHGLGEFRFNISGKAHTIPRNAPSLFNLWANFQEVPSTHPVQPNVCKQNIFWDGRVAAIGRGPCSDFFNPKKNAYLTYLSPAASGAITITASDSLNLITNTMSKLFDGVLDLLGAADTVNWKLPRLAAVALQAMFPVTSEHEMRTDAFPSNRLTEPGPPSASPKFTKHLLTDTWNGLMTQISEGTKAEDSELSVNDAYVTMFKAAYPKTFVGDNDVTSVADIGFEYVAYALAAFEVGAYAATNTRLNQLFANGTISEGDIGLAKLKNAEKEEALRGILYGAQAFLDMKCDGCHSGGAFSDGDFHNTLMPQYGPGKNDGNKDSDGDVIPVNYQNVSYVDSRTGETKSKEQISTTDDLGRWRVSDEDDDKYAFRTPTLINAQATRPFGFLGQYETLATHIKHYVDPKASLEGYKIGEQNHLKNEYDSHKGQLVLYRAITVDDDGSTLHPKMWKHSASYVTEKLRSSCIGKDETTLNDEQIKLCKTKKAFEAIGTEDEQLKTVADIAAFIKYWLVDDASIDGLLKTFPPEMMLPGGRDVIDGNKKAAAMRLLADTISPKGAARSTLPPLVASPNAPQNPSGI